MIKRWLSIFLLGLNMVNVTGHPKVVNVYHWSGYLPKAVLKQFTEETGIQVNSSSYDSNEALYAKLKAMPHHSYDVIMPSSYTIHRMIQENMLQSLEKKRLTHMQHIDTQFLDKPFDPTNQYSVPYLFSTSGLVVNRRYYDPKTVTDWADLWQLRFKNKLLLLDDIRELFSIALLTLGFSPNTKNPSEIHHAFEKLRVLLKNVRVFNSEGMIDLYATEELSAGIGWSGDIYRAHLLNPDIEFIYPSKGYILSIDNLAIPKGAEHLDEAYQFINFLLRPDVAASISMSTGYGTVNAAARENLPPDMLLDPTIYPDLITLKRGIVQLSAGEQTVLYERYWERLKIEG